MASKKRSSYRLSSLLSSLSSDQDSNIVASADSVRSNTTSSSSEYLSPTSTSGHIPTAGRLTKDRTASHQLLAPTYPPPPPPDPSVHRQPTITPVHIDPEQLRPRLDSGSGSRTVSPARSQPPSRSVTPVLEVPADRPFGLPTPSTHTKAKRKSWLLGGGLRSSDGRIDESDHGPLAWVVGHHGKVPYNLSLLLGAEKVPELWDDNGDTFVYLFPRTSGKGPSFRIDSSVYSASPVMTRLAFGRIYSEPAIPSSSRQTASPPPDPNGPEGSSDGSKGSRTLSDATDDIPSDIHLYVPLSLSTDYPSTTPGGPEPRPSPSDVEKLVAFRNLFGFLIGQSLVATEKHSSIFDIFLRISDLLQEYEFSNLDGSTYGEVAIASFEAYVDELHMADVRASREKTIEGIVLGERMRSVMLYNEAFVHGVGKYEEIVKLQSHKFNLISPITRNRMERASMDLFLRLKNLNTRLEEFEFPAVFSGIMNSKTADESKLVRFDAWKSAFMITRKQILAYYKGKYGSWPPKASSKKNSLNTSGLNRRVLMDLYHDVSQLYDMLVDRKSLTTRSVDGPSDDEINGVESITARALRRVMSEYDRSSPPVQPPVPFDIPLYPSLKSTRRDYGTGDEKKDTKARRKKLKDDEIAAVLKAARNPDSDIASPFLDTFRELERKAAHGKSLDDLCDLRSGQWMFMYAVLQALPMLVVDAPGVKWTEGVEYFLCEPPRSGVPWAREDTGVHRNWYGIAGSSGVVSLPSDIVEHGVEGIYHRSHCWKMAEKWTSGSELLSAAVVESLQEPLPAPTDLLQPSDGRSRSESPSRRRESVMMLGLEALPMPAGVAPVSPALRPKSSNDPTKTFDAILQSTELSAKPKKKK